MKDEKDDELERALKIRRSVLGDAYVDRMTRDVDPVSGEFQDYVTRMAWGVWARGGPLTNRDRSLLVLAMTAALGRMDEFRLHARSSVRAGVTAAELDELTFQIAAYCGAPAGVSARRVLRELRAEEEEG